MLTTTVALSGLTTHHRWTRSRRVSITLYLKPMRHGISELETWMPWRFQQANRHTESLNHPHANSPFSKKALVVHPFRVPSYSQCKLHVFWHDGDPPGMDHTQVCILKQSNAECFHRILNNQQRKNVLRWNKDRNLACLNPAALPLQGAGIASCG